MSYIEKLQQMSDLQAAIAQHGAIPVALLNKINYKLRLEWNYTSNSMEGNSLTKRETRTVMIDAIDVNGKPLKDIQEMKNHDKVVSTIMRMGKGELNMSESRIKEIHTGIMYEENPENQKYIGQWKNADNYMYNNEGERYDFVPHDHVSQRMHELVNWTNDEKEKIARDQKGAIHPVSLALKFHLDYLNIHPFYDGNGRTARIFTNLILISYGYPPLYIKETEKKNYYKYLTDIQSYGGDTNLFNDFMAGLLVRSLQITLDTIEGKEIEEEDDFVKEIQLLKAKGSIKGKPKSPKVLYNTYRIIETELWERIKQTLGHFKELFNEFQIFCSVNNSHQISDPDWHLTASEVNGILNNLGKKKIFGIDIYENDVKNIGWEYKLFSLNGAEIPIDFCIYLNIDFRHYGYDLNIMATGSQDEIFLKSIYNREKKYEESFSINQLSEVVNAIKNHLINEIKVRIDGSDNKNDHY
ncbi:Fic family protein [Mucilaginibacter sp. RB4R14]|uniref:Fic family protein n=1 Tax=Mucilaginibacter aurantiaciroseus TaxID=2949308 RepID=UPI0020901917|nr:Fic family protein [Mucilaginibacter aurantiaciroseus]MCO5937169.1 Fic family protein [Mucilaginibacter aurantiaciroseus]